MSTRPSQQRRARRIAPSAACALAMLVGCNQFLGVDNDYTVGDAVAAAGGAAASSSTSGTGSGSGSGGSGAAGSTSATGGSGGTGASGGGVGGGQGGAGGGGASVPIVVANGPGLNRDVPADAYDGSLGSMECEQLAVVAPAGALVQRVEVVVGVDSTYVGDTVIKLVSPSNTILSLVSRPGALEGADDGSGGTGEGSDLLASHPLTFRDDAPYDAEQMGAGLDDSQAVCKDDNQCDFFPNSGSGPGTNLADFVGEDPNGNWRVCVADASGSFGATYDFVELSIWAG